MKVYLKLLKCDEKANSNVLVNQVEKGGWCTGVVVDENGKELDKHTSSTVGWLRQDLLRHLPDGHNFDVVDELFVRPT